MARYRANRRAPLLRPGGILVVVIAVTAGAWWYVPRDAPSSEPNAAEPARPQRYLTSDRPEGADNSNGSNPSATEKGDSTNPNTAPTERTAPEPRSQSLLTAGRQALQRGELIAGRTYLSEALKLGIDGSEATLLRADLTRIGTDTIFSPRILPGDPHCERYVIQPGDSLGKIARANQVSAELLATINGIVDINRIRAGQTIKIVKGPFHAVVDKSSYSLDVYLGTTFAKHFKVGLGAEGSTPTGQWQVSTKLKNPTFYPPRGGSIVAADDPQNPLGERWIGLVGISGEAVGQMRYGIHGTVDPSSIGQNVSMGCIRMYNEDVQSLYTYLIEKHSTVLVQD